MVRYRDLVGAVPSIFLILLSLISVQNTCRISPSTKHRSGTQIFSESASLVHRPLMILYSHLCDSSELYLNYSVLGYNRGSRLVLHTRQGQFWVPHRPSQKMSVLSSLLRPLAILWNQACSFSLLTPRFDMRDKFIQFYGPAVIIKQTMEICKSQLSLIGKGAGSNIYMYGQPGTAVALKVVRSGSKESRHLHNEHAILKELFHDNVISAFKLRINVNTDNLGMEPFLAGLEPTDSQKSGSYNQLSDILVLEYAEKGNLMKIVRERQLSVPQKREMFYQVCEAVQYLHCNYIVHRDLKLQNILVGIKQGNLVCKLGDFGFATSCRSEQGLVLFNSFKGTKRGYMAPQIHQVLEPGHAHYDARKADVFAMGVVLFALVLGRLPFEYARMQNKLYKLIIQQRFQDFWKEHAAAVTKVSDLEHSMVEDFKELFVSMVRHSPEQRVTMQDVLDSAWLNGVRHPAPV